jgi:hypothetical protein
LISFRALIESQVIGSESATRSYPRTFAKSAGWNAIGILFLQHSVTPARRRRAWLQFIIDERICSETCFSAWFLVLGAWDLVLGVLRFTVSPLLRFMYSLYTLRLTPYALHLTPYSLRPTLLFHRIVNPIIALCVLYGAIL